MATSKIKILVVDDHRMFREAIVEHINDQEDMNVVGETDNGANVIAMINSLCPDLVLLDINLTGLDGDEVLRIMKQLEMQTPVVVFSMHADPSHVGRILSLGVNGFLLKDEALDNLTDAIRTVNGGGEYFSHRISVSATPKPGGKQQTDGLTEKEIEVIALIAGGLSSNDIAAKLGRSVKTVESHRSNISKKLGINNVASLTRYAIRNGFISP